MSTASADAVIERAPTASLVSLALGALTTERHKEDVDQISAAACRTPRRRGVGEAEKLAHSGWTENFNAGFRHLKMPGFDA